MKTITLRLWLPFVLALCLLAAVPIALAAWSDPAPVIVDDSVTLVGDYSSVDGYQIAAVDIAAISYYDQTNDALKFVTGSADGSSWSPPVTVDSSSDNVGLYTSLVIYQPGPVNAYAFISYYDADNGNLKFARSSGSSWISTIVDSSGDVGQYTSIALVNGKPAISFYDVTNGHLKFARADDEWGTLWSSITVVDSTNDVGMYSSLAVVNGIPVISYYDATNGDLKYAYATDADGSSWGTMTVDAAVDVGQYTSVTQVNNNPAISYRDVTNGTLKFARFNGMAWDIVTVDGGSGVNVGNYTSLAVVNGNPAISYVDNTNDTVNYVRALNVNGTSWGTPVVLDGECYGVTSLAVVGGNPAVSYEGSWVDITIPASGTRLMYTRAGNPNAVTATDVQSARTPAWVALLSAVMLVAGVGVIYRKLKQQRTSL